MRLLREVTGWESHSVEDAGWAESSGPMAKWAYNSIPGSCLLQTFKVHGESFSGLGCCL